MPAYIVRPLNPAKSGGRSKKGRGQLKVSNHKERGVKGKVECTTGRRGREVGVFRI